MADPDILVIGTGMGGATLANRLAGTGARITILERGGQLPAAPQNRDATAIFEHGCFRNGEEWHDASGQAFHPGNYYYRGGNSKFYGAVLARFRASDFDGVEHMDGFAPPWPFRYAELAPHYERAERLYEVRGDGSDDPTEPPRAGAYPFPPVPDEPPIAALRARLKSLGLHPYSLPLGVDIDAWLAGGATPWDAYPDARSGKKDAETCALMPILGRPGVTLIDRAEVLRLVPSPDGRRIAHVEYRRDGATEIIAAGRIVLAAGAVQSAALLLRSGDHGLANRSGQVGRNFMNHNASLMLAIDPLRPNHAVYQKTFGLNDWYLGGDGRPPLGNVQLVGKVSEAHLKSKMPWVPRPVLRSLTRHSTDFYIMTEDLPDPDSRVRVDGSRIVLEWRRTNMRAQRALVRKMRRVLRRSGFPVVVSQLFDQRTPSHQCGTIRIGEDPAKAPLDPYGRSYDHENLYVADSSVLVTSAAVNPSLTIAALALRTADHIASTA